MLKMVFFRQICVTKILIWRCQTSDLAPCLVKKTLIFIYKI
jgi:hypothetical protein